MILVPPYSGMIQAPILFVEDLDRSVRWYLEALDFDLEYGFGTGEDDGPVVVAHLARGLGQALVLAAIPPSASKVEGRVGWGIRLSFDAGDRIHELLDRANAKGARLEPA